MGTWAERLPRMAMTAGAAVLLTASGCGGPAAECDPNGQAHCPEGYVLSCPDDKPHVVCTYKDETHTESDGAYCSQDGWGLDVALDPLGRTEVDCDEA